MPNPSKNDVVVIHAWYPTYYGIEVSYWDAWKKRAKSDPHAHIGHVAVSIRHTDENGEVTEKYFSLMPKYSNFLHGTPADINTLLDDINEQENLLPTKQIALFCLDTEKMLKRAAELLPNILWKLTGDKFVFNPKHKPIYNCSGFVKELLIAGGLYENLLDPSENKNRLVTPKDIAEIALKASVIESQKYPERDEALKDYIQTYSNKLLQESVNIKDAGKSFNKFLEDNPDFYLLAYQYKPELLTSILSTVYKNIQHYLNSKLLQLTEEFFSRENKDEKEFLGKLDHLLYAGATLSYLNSSGANALDIMVKQDYKTGIQKVLGYFPNALDQKTENKEKTIVDLEVTLPELAMIKTPQDVTNISNKLSGRSQAHARFFKNCNLDQKDLLGSTINDAMEVSSSNSNCLSPC